VAVAETLLTINQRSKDVPYPSDVRDDGSLNHGFLNLKGAEAQRISDVHEAADCPALKNILATINAPESPFFSVGCEKALTGAVNKFWKKGYCEFAFNDANRVKDAMYYFHLFFHFNRAQEPFDADTKIQYLWDLQPANFRQCDVVGFTCCVWITVGKFDDASKCSRVWAEAVTRLGDFLASVKAEPSAPIY